MDNLFNTNFIDGNIKNALKINILRAFNLLYWKCFIHLTGSTHILNLEKKFCFSIIYDPFFISHFPKFACAPSCHVGFGLPCFLLPEGIKLKTSLISCILYFHQTPKPSKTDFYNFLMFCFIHILSIFFTASSM